MSDVFLVGAGFSRAVSDSMPLMPDLLNQVLDILAEKHDRPNLAPFSNNLEHWLSYLAADQPWLTASENFENRATYVRATAAVTRTIKQAEHGLMLSAVDGAPDWLAALSRHWLRVNSHIITFNYDTLVERALTESGLSSWAELYVLPLVGGNTSGRSMDTYYTFDAHMIALFKMHGSVNWKFSGLWGASSDPVHLIGQSRGWGGHKSYIQEIEFSKPHLESLIVPPTADKAPYYAIAALRYQWHLARETLARAESITVVGYSMPETDRAICDLVGTAIAQNALHERIVTVVDISDALVDRLHRMLPPATRLDRQFCGSDDAITRFVSSLPGSHAPSES